MKGFSIRKAGLKDAEEIAHVHYASWQTTYPGLMPESIIQAKTLQNRVELWTHILQDASSTSDPLKSFDPIYVAEKTNSSADEISDRQIIGFVNGGPCRSSELPYDSEIYAIYLLAAYQHRGIGTKLFQAMLQQLQRVGYQSVLIWVLEGNPATQFYENHGGTVRERKIENLHGSSIKEVGYVWNFE